MATKKINSNQKDIKGRRAKFPSKIPPMLATLVDKPFDSEGWIYEVKWDGYRTIAFCNTGNVELKSRNDKSFDEKFYPVHRELQRLNMKAVLDGEIVVLNSNGQANFSALQNWRSEADGEIYFYVFDLLWLNGKDIMDQPLTYRRDLLSKIVPENSIVRMSEHFDVNGLKFFDIAKKAGIEGIMAKKAESTYVPGLRSKEWLKIKSKQTTGDGNWWLYEERRFL